MSGLGLPPPPPGDVVQKRLTGPAIALIATAVVNAAVSLLLWLSLLVRLGEGGPARTYGSAAERAGAHTAELLSVLASIASVVAAPLLILAAIQMMKGRSYGLARSGAIVAMIPLTSCCCLLGVPVGIWTLVTLNRPEVAAYFRRE